MFSRVFANPDPCTGCQNCMAVCSQSHFRKAVPMQAAIRVELDPFSGRHTIVTCRQCEDAPCAASCPADAISVQEPPGVWVIDELRCIRCGACVAACPFGAMIWREPEGQPFKCDMCGGDPKCVRACHFGALQCVILAEDGITGIPPEDLDAMLGRGEPE